MPIYTRVDDAPKPFMLAMANPATGLHLFFTREEAETFALGILESIYDG